MFKDHFSRHAGDYRRYRPGYPPELFAWLAELCAEHRCAVDCATGNGQAAAALARHFDTVVANDGSLEQLRQAERCPGVTYVVNLAERLAIADGAADFVGAAQAAHWFDFEPYHAEVRRVLKPGGVVALWTYQRCTSLPAIDAVLEHFRTTVMAPWWPPERAYVESAYQTLPFPFAEIAAPEFAIETRWSLAALLGYVSSWSSVQRCRTALGTDPLVSLEQELAGLWPRDRDLVLRWPISLRVGRC